MMTVPSRRAALFLIAGVAAVVIAMPASWKQRLMLQLAPSAARAYSFGIAHIDEPGPQYDLDDASYFFQRVIDLDDSYPLTHHQLARIHFLRGEYPDALREVSVEIALHPELAAPYYLRGLVEGYLRQYDDAVRDYRTYVVLHPEGWEGRVDLAWVLIQQRQLNEALAVLDEGLRQHPENPWLMSTKATVLFEMKRISEALPLAQAAVQKIDALSETRWHAAYPGNAPRAAEQGLRTLRDAAHANAAKIEASLKTNE